METLPTESKTSSSLVQDIKSHNETKSEIDIKSETNEKETIVQVNSEATTSAKGEVLFEPQFIITNKIGIRKKSTTAPSFLFYKKRYLYKKRIQKRLRIQARKKQDESESESESSNDESE